MWGPSQVTLPHLRSQHTGRPRGFWTPSVPQLSGERTGTPSHKTPSSSRRPGGPSPSGGSPGLPLDGRRVHHLQRGLWKLEARALPPPRAPGVRGDSGSPVRDPRVEDSGLRVSPPHTPLPGPARPIRHSGVELSPLQLRTARTSHRRTPRRASPRSLSAPPRAGARPGLPGPGEVAAEPAQPCPREPGDPAWPNAASDLGRCVTAPLRVRPGQPPPPRPWPPQEGPEAPHL